MSSRIPNCRAEGAEVKRLVGELAEMEPVAADLQVFSDDEMRRLKGLLARLLDDINEHSG